eukprot:7900732-Prorocentrum_lima.AAC.1
MEAHGSCTHGMTDMHNVMWGRIHAGRSSAPARSVADWQESAPGITMPHVLMGKEQHACKCL